MDREDVVGGGGIEFEVVGFCGLDIEIRFNRKQDTIEGTRISVVAGSKVGRIGLEVKREWDIKVGFGAEFHSVVDVYKVPVLGEEG